MDRDQYYDPRAEYLEDMERQELLARIEALQAALWVERSVALYGAYNRACPPEDHVARKEAAMTQAYRELVKEGLLDGG